MATSPIVENMAERILPGLNAAILSILSHHIGRNNAISRGGLCLELDRAGFNVHERLMRLAISQLRKRGNMIGSAPGNDGGYYMIADQDEFDEFARTEYRAKILDMQETLTAMQREASRRWPKPGQLSLFG